MDFSKCVEKMDFTDFSKYAEKTHKYFRILLKMWKKALLFLDITKDAEKCINISRIFEMFV